MSTLQSCWKRLEKSDGRDNKLNILLLKYTCEKFSNRTKKQRKRILQRNGNSVHFRKTKKRHENIYLQSHKENKNKRKHIRHLNEQL